MQEFKIFLDGVEFFDIPQELTMFEKTLIRDGEDDFIFRTKNELELTFIGDIYEYICQKRTEDLCSEIQILIQELCNDVYTTLFDGVYKNAIATHYPNEKKIKSKLYDANYSANLLERKSSEVFLNLTTSIGGIQIGECPFIIADTFDQNNANLKSTRFYKVKDVFQWLIRYWTDDKVTFSSDFLTNNNHAITTGAMLRIGNVGGSQITNTFQNQYLIPNISYEQLFIEIRKILRIYSSVENNEIRIENEEYFFNSNAILNIDTLPFGTEEEFYEDEVYSQINLGSIDTKTDVGNYYTPKVKLFAHEDETYNNCSNCVLDRTLDLKNEWIIDSNVIHEARSGLTEFWDDRIFIVELNGNNVAQYQETDSLDGSNSFYYNEKFNNINKLINWEGGLPNCVTNVYNEEPCSTNNYNTADGVTLYHDDLFNGAKHIGINIAILKFSNELCDPILIANHDYQDQNVNIFDSGATPPYRPLINNESGSGSIIVIPFSGQYQFDLSATMRNVMTVGGGTNIGPFEELKWELKILVFKGGFYELEGGGNVLPFYNNGVAYDHSGDFDDNFVVTLNTTTPLLTLPAGAVVLPTLRIKTEKLGIGINNGTAVEVQAGYFNMVQAEYNFIEDLPTSTLEPRLIKTKLKLPLCCDEFNLIEQNKYGIIKLAGRDTWIKELKYKRNSVSEFTLITRDTFCGYC